jgi:hypothetical protein
MAGVTIQMKLNGFSILAVFVMYWRYCMNHLHEVHKSVHAVGWVASILSPVYYKKLLNRF